MQIKLKILVCVGFILLTGCASPTQSYDDLVNKALSRPLAMSISRTKNHLKYYVLPDVGVRSTTDISSVLEIEGYPIVMDVSVSDIIAREYYNARSFVSKIREGQATFVKNGTYVDRNGTIHSYVFSLIEVGNNVAIIIENGIISMMGVVDASMLQRVVDAMFVTMRSVEVNQEEVAKLYSNKIIVDYKAVHEEFFDHRVPESGSLIDIYNQLHPNDAIDTGTQNTEDQSDSGMMGGS